MAIPTKDALLVAWSTNFDNRASSSAATYGLTPAQALAYTALHDPYLAANQAVVDARAAGTESRPLLATRDSARKALLVYARELYGFIQASTTVTDAAKIEIGVHVRSVPSPVPAPAVAPMIDIVSMIGPVMKIRLHDGSLTSKAKPAGVQGATIFTHIGETVPAEVSDWAFQGSTSRTLVEISFSPELAPGTKVWACAFWYSARGLSGPACQPVSAQIQYSTAPQQQAA